MASLIARNMGIVVEAVINTENYKHFIIMGCGTTKEQAAAEFMEEFHRLFPRKKGMYDLMIRVPLTYDVDKVLEGEQHAYRLRGTWGLVAELEPPADATTLNMKDL